MDRKIFFSFTLFDLRKLIGASILFFLALVIGVKEAGEPSTMLQVDYFSEEIKPDHPSPSASPQNDPFSSLCQKNQTFCEKIIRTGTLTQSEKRSYANQYFQIANFLEENLMQGDPLHSVFKTLIINGETGKRRGGATRKRITINLSSMGDPTEFRGVLTHEFGHIVDLGVLNGISKTKNGNYTEFGKVKFAIDDPSLEYYRYSWDSENIRSQSANKKDFCSGYGMTNPFEDFAECHNLFLNNRQLFRTMASETPVMKNKYNFFANLFDNAILKDNAYQLPYKERRPRDTTLI